MKAITMGIEAKVDELMEVLERDVEHIKMGLSRLNELRSLVVKRDDGALIALLESIGLEAGSYHGNELKRQKIREELAFAFGCDVGEMKLSRIESELAGKRKEKVGEMKFQLRRLTAELKKEHFSTSMLLSDCARFNSMLLRRIFDIGRTDGAMTYTYKGARKRQSGPAFVNMEF